MNNYKAISFDLYNTILEIETDEESAETFDTYSKLLSEKKIFIPPNTLKEDYKNILQETIKTTKQGREIDIKKVFRKIFIKNKVVITGDRVDELIYLFRIASRKKIRLKIELRDFLKELKTCYKLYIVSDAQKYFAFPEIKLFSIDKIFNRIILSQIIGYKKSSGKLFEYLMKEEHLGKDDIIHIGDDEDSDLQGASKSGIKCIIIDSVDEVIQAFQSIDYEISRGIERFKD
ncbi:MAG: HAD family hydrolase [Candidatus Hydrogenedentota bacterium]